MRVEPKRNVLFSEEREVQEKYEVVDNHNDALELIEDDEFYSYWDDSNENDD